MLGAWTGVVALEPGRGGRSGELLARGMEASGVQRQGLGLGPPCCPVPDPAWNTAEERYRPAKAEERQGRKPAGAEAGGLRLKKKGQEGGWGGC